MRVALLLTLGRIAICPIFLVVYLFYREMGIHLQLLPYLLIFLVTLCELTDIFDGVAARRSNGVTELGKILDPMADSIVRLSVFLSFTQGIIKLPLLLVILFVCRDAVISTLRTLCALRGKALAARTSGKVKAVIQGVAIFSILLTMIPYTQGWIALSQLRLVSFWVVAATALYTLWSGFEYIWVYRRYIREAWSV